MHTLLAGRERRTLADVVIDGAKDLIPDTLAVRIRVGGYVH